MPCKHRQSYEPVLLGGLNGLKEGRQKEKINWTRAPGSGPKPEEAIFNVGQPVAANPTTGGVSAVGLQTNFKFAVCPPP